MDRPLWKRRCLIKWDTDEDKLKWLRVRLTGKAHMKLPARRYAKVCKGIENAFLSISRNQRFANPFFPYM